ncbi:hypothetical protein DL96DRAFT_1462531 [Flagelloscypha sp. PMI_526]|nr:hypothetical protein DL96DRAFT_1462531 [Flagelloscypha sp. PMI_526]
MKHGVPLGRIILQIGNTEGKECQICYDTSARKEKCSLDSCQHILCRPCLAQYILTKVEEKQVPIWCPVCWAEDRPNLLAFEADALQTLGFQQSDIDAFITLTMQSISLPLTCPECAHEFSVDREDFSGLTTIGCPLPTCKHIWCKFCRQEIPFGYVGEHTCDGSSELKALMTEKGWKFCPACRAPHEKVSGCNHIICTAQGCSAHYCFKCGKLMTTSKNRQEIANAIQQHANSC